MKPNALTHHWDVLLGGEDAATPTNVQPIFTKGQLTGQATRANEEATLMGTWDPQAILAEIAKRSINDPFAKKTCRKGYRAIPRWSTGNYMATYSTFEGGPTYLTMTPSDFKSSATIMTTWHQDTLANEGRQCW